MATQVLYASNNRPGPTGRYVGVLSDGSAVIAVLALENDLATFHLKIFHSANRTTWTLKNNYTFTSAPSQYNNYVSMSVDDLNNLHFTWVSGGASGPTYGGKICYVKFTYSAGPTWTAGSEEVVKADNSLHSVVGLDIDVLDGASNLVAVGFSYFNTSTNASSDDIAIRRTSSPAWVVTEVTNVAGTGSSFGYVSVARGSTTTVAASFSGDGGGTRIPYLRVWTVTASSGAISQTWNQNLTILNTAYFTFSQVYTVDTNKWALIGSNSNLSGGTVTMVAALFNATSYLITPVESAAVSGNARANTASALIEPASLATQTAVLFHGNSNGDLYALIANISGSAITFSSDIKYEAVGAQFAPVPFGGNNRNKTLQKIDLLLLAGSSFMARPATVPATPTNVGPNGNVASATPTLTATLAPNAPRVKGKWELALNSGFTTSLRTVIDPDSDFISSGVATEVVPSASRLSKATWYVRAYAIDELGQSSPASVAGTMTIGYSSSATNLNPSGAITVEFGAGTVAFDWDFSSSSGDESQTAYQLIIRKVADDTLVYDSGKVASTASYTEIPVSATYKNVSLKWQVRVWDLEDTVGSYSDYAVFILSDAPLVAVTAPAEASVQNNPAPTVTWTFTGYGGRTQKQFRVRFLTTGGTELYDSEWTLSSVSSFTPSGAVLSNSSTYVVEVSVRDTADLNAIDTNTFTTSWTAPTAPTLTVDTSSYDTLGYVHLSWPAGTVDANFAGWRVYRRLTGTTTWTLLGTVGGTTGTVTFDDRFPGSNMSYDYDVRQVANRFGSPVESASAPVSGTPAGSHYWLLHPTDSSLDTLLYTVTSDEFNDEYESAEINLLGRGRKVEYGTRWGYSGTLVSQIRDQTGLTSRQALQRIRALKDAQVSMYLRNPFGDVLVVDMGDVSISRMSGVGTREFSTLTIPYKELSA